MYEEEDLRKGEIEDPYAPKYSRPANRRLDDRVAGGDRRRPDGPVSYILRRAGPRAQKRLDIPDMVEEAVEVVLSHDVVKPAVPDLPQRVRAVQREHSARAVGSCRRTV